MLHIGLEMWLELLPIVASLREGILLEIVLNLWMFGLLSAILSVIRMLSNESSF